MRIVVLAGGLSPECDVSLASGSLIANALIQKGHEVALVDVYRGIKEEIAVETLFFSKESGKEFSFSVPEREPDLEKIKEESGNGEALIGKNVLEICKLAELSFIALHGGMGENGQIQAMFDVLGIRYTGSGYSGCLLAMDKDISKKLLRADGILTADWVTVDKSGELPFERMVEIGFPCVVKPCGCGSSVGISIVKNQNELQQALVAANRYEDRCIIEKMIVGREFSVGILDGEALPAIEVIPKAGFYDYKNKYQQGLTEEICPAVLDEAIHRHMQEQALLVHKTLLLGSYSRIDFIIDAQGDCYCLEANTLPGMTPTSLLPQEAAAVGISYGELCEKIVKKAF